MSAPSNALHDEKIQRTLQRLHQQAMGDRERRLARAASGVSEDGLVRMGELYLAVSEEEGRLLYLLARGCRAGQAFEFGASFGVSTLYLGAALRDTGGHLVTTEVHQDKCRALQATLVESGLDSVVTVLEGDARQTLNTIAGPLDFVFLDGWKSLYLPVLEQLVPILAPGALIAADNIDHDAAGEYAKRVRSGGDFVSSTLGKMEVSCYTG